MAVQRQTATSRSASPSSSEQHGVFDGDPITAPINPPSKLAQTPNFMVSLGQVVFSLGTCGGGGQAGFGFGFGFGFGQSPQALTRVKKIRFRARKRASLAISKINSLFFKILRLSLFGMT